ncbi:Ig-like domain-containing protein [Pedosphaera parvula]|nr:Ig-like domain-containing protein [Pedosphaera parvula]
MKQGDAPRQKGGRNSMIIRPLTIIMSTILVLCALTTVASAQPINDNFSNSIPILELDSTNIATLAGATKEPGEPNHAGVQGMTSVWYSWTATQSGLAFVTAIHDGSAWDTGILLAAYVGDSVDALSPVGDNRSLGLPFLLDTMIFRVRAGQNYKIAFGYQNAPNFPPPPATRNFKLSFQPAPDNDDYANPVILTGINCNPSGTTYASTEEPGELNWGDDLVPGSVWYSWTAPYTGYAYLLSDPFDNLDILVYTGPSLVGVGFIARSSHGENISFPVEAGTTYHFSVKMFKKISARNPFGNRSGPFSFSLGQAAIAIEEPFSPSNFIGPTNIAVSVFLDPSNNNVRKVSFYDGSKFLYEADTPPYSFLWKDVLSGVHSLTAVSVGDVTNVSSPVVINVHPANDHFTNRFQLVGSNLSFPASLALATWEPGELYFGNEAVGEICWWTWTAPRSGTLVLSATQGALLNAYTGNDLQNLVRIAGHAVNSFEWEVITRDPVYVPVEAGQSYQISADSYWVMNHDFRIPSFAAPQGEFTISLQMQLPPPNDNFEKRILLNGTAIRVRGSTLGASSQPNEPAHGGIAQGNSIWYSWKAPISGSVSLATNSIVIKTNQELSPYGFPVPWTPTPIDTIVSTFRPDYPVFAVYTGSSLATLTNISSGPLVRFDAVAGQTYQIAVDGNQANPANLQFYLNEVPPAANDNFYLAPSIFGNTQVSGSNLGATTQPGEPASNAGDTSGHSIWWTWRAPYFGVCSIDLWQSDDWRSPITVFVGNLGTLKPVASGHTGGVTFFAIPGVPYHICVGSDNGYTGNIRMNIREYPYHPAPILFGGLTGTGPGKTR